VKKFNYIVPAALFFLVTNLPVHAGGVKGCTDSPEIPTALLGLIVGAASVGYFQIRQRIGTRKKPDSK
jgi:XrtJ-associated TM-motif-TM protein